VITGEAARADVQRWRARSSAILTGSGTVLADNPRLTVRLSEEVSFTPPWRVLLDSRLQTPSGSHVLDGTAPTLVLHGAKANPDYPGFQAAELAVVDEHGGGLDLHAVMAELARRQVSEVHVEAGPRLCGALFAAGLADELLLYIAPVLLGDAARPLLGLPSLSDMAARWKLQTLDRRVLGDDLRLQLRPVD